MQGYSDMVRRSWAGRCVPTMFRARLHNAGGDFEPVADYIKNAKAAACDFAEDLLHDGGFVSGTEVEVLSPDGRTTVVCVEVVETVERSCVVAEKE